MRRAIVTSLFCVCLGVGIFAVTSGAHAAPPDDWNGLYIGGLVGGAWGTSGSASGATNSTSFFSLAAELGPGEVAAFNADGKQNLNPNGFLGGFEAGYNFQRSIWLFGVEGDIDWFDLSGGATSGPFAIAPGVNATITTTESADWLATLRGRVGVAPGNWLFYATGGAALARFNARFAVSIPALVPPIAETASVSTTRAGYALGGGIETKLSPNWSVKGEYLFADFGSLSASGASGLPPQPFVHTLNLQFNILRFAVNYHF
jgi:outer membrane immunogenic protein